MLLQSFDNILLFCHYSTNGKQKVVVQYGKKQIRKYCDKTISTKVYDGFHKISVSSTNYLKV